jgi:hypothetical protein
MAFEWIRRLSSRRKPRSRRSSPLRTGAALLLSLMAGTALALPPEFSARYEVSHSGLTLGEAHVHFKKIGEDRYRYSSLTRPVGLTKLFYDVEIEEVSEGLITENGYRPERYAYDRRGRKARSASVKFDWEEQRVVNDVAGKAWEMDIPSGALDRMVSQLQLMFDLENNDQELVYRIADGGKLKEYTLKFAGREILETPHGRLETIKVSRRAKEDDRETTFWAAPALDYLAVRIEHRDKGDNFEMTLEEQRGFALGKPGAEPAPVDPNKLWSNRTLSAEGLVR